MRTFHPSVPPAQVRACRKGNESVIRNCAISAGCEVFGATIDHSVLGFEVEVQSGAEIFESVIIGKSHIGKNVTLKKCVLDKHVYVADNVKIGVDPDHDKQRGFTVSECGVTVVPQNTDVLEWSMKVLFAVSEIEGLVKTGGLADVARYLPVTLNDKGHDTRVIMPYYRDVAAEGPAPQRTFSLSVRLNREIEVRVHEIVHNELTIYAVDIPKLYDRDGIYSDNYHAYDDNGERFSVFSIVTLEFFQHFASQIDFHPDVIHCNDWHTAVLPALLKSDRYWQQQPTKTLITIHNGAFQGIFAKYSVPSLSFQLGEHFADFEDDVVNFLKLGIIHSDEVVAVSPNYAEELKTELGSHHLFDIIYQHQHKLTGVLNGCDYKDWDPSSDPHLTQNYDDTSLKDKVLNKLALQKECGLEQDANIPVISQVCRLTDQKGLNFLLPALRELVQHKVQICIAGTGDPLYVDQLEYLAKKHQGKIHFYHGFSERIAHTYMAGSDFFMVPSLFEPCGLTQMYALAYGTLPIVREVGGLKDTVVDIAQTDATGIVFKEPNMDHLISGVRRGLLFFHEDKQQFESVQRRAMNTKFSWADSADEYIGLYEKICHG